MHKCVVLTPAGILQLTCLLIARCAGTVLNWFIDLRVERPYLIFPGILFAVAAIALSALAHQSHEKVRRRNLGTAIKLAAQHDHSSHVNRAAYPVW